MYYFYSESRWRYLKPGCLWCNSVGSTVVEPHSQAGQIDVLLVDHMGEIGLAAVFSVLTVPLNSQIEALCSPSMICSFHGSRCAAIPLPDCIDSVYED